MYHIVEHLSRGNKVLLTYKIVEAAWPHTLSKRSMEGFTHRMLNDDCITNSIVCRLIPYLIFGPMSLLKQFSISRMVVVGLICLPLLVYAQGKHGSKIKIKTKGGAAQAAPAKPDVANDGIDYHAVGSPFPPFRVVSKDGKEYTGQSLNSNANLFVMMFNPTCEHCEDMTADIEKNITMFKQSNIVLVAAPMMGPYLDGFINGLKTKQYPQLKIGLDSASFIDKTFNYITLPQINVYSADRKLIKSFSGITTIDSLKPYIQ
jgi:hypothetical protein